MTEPEQPLRGGGTAPASRVGTTVRRQTGPWTPAVHALLRYLEDVGFDGAPRVHGIDEQGREVLTFIGGEDGHHARKAALHDDRTLAEVGRMIRRYHDAVAGFVPPVDAAWRFQGNEPRTGIVRLSRPRTRGLGTSSRLDRSHPVSIEGERRGCSRRAAPVRIISRQR